MTSSKPKHDAGIDWLFYLIAFYFVGNICVRLIAPDTLGLDEAEQSFRSQWLAAGYGPQPPFYNWLQYLVFQITGVRVWALSLVKNTMLFTAFVCYALTARLLLKDKALVVIAALGLVTLPQVAFEMQRDLTHTVAVFFSACLFLYGFVRSLKQPSILSYLLTGIGLGLGLLSKYNFALLPAAAILAALFDPMMRRRVFDLRVVVTALVALIIISPHALWLVDNFQMATARTIEKMTGGDAQSYPAQVAGGIVSLIKAAIGFAAVTVVIFLITFGRRFGAIRSASSQWSRFIERLMAFLLIGLLCLILFAGAEDIRDRWLTPMLFVMPLYLCLKLEAADVGGAAGLKRFLSIAIAIMMIVPMVLFGRIVTGGFTHDYDRLNISYDSLVPQLTAEAQPAMIVSETSLMAGNMRLHMPDVPVVALDYPGFSPPLASVSGKPLLLIWQAHKAGVEDIPVKFEAWLAAHPETRDIKPTASTLAFPYHYGAASDSYRFGYAWISLDVQGSSVAKPSP